MKNIKKTTMKTMVTLLIIMSFGTSVFASTSADLDVFVDYKKSEFSAPVTTIENKIYIPVRTFADIIGGEVVWNPNTKQVEILKGDDVYSIKANSNIATVNGNTVKSEDFPINVDQVTLVPATYISDVFGVNLNLYKDVVVIDTRSSITAKDMYESEALLDEAMKSTSAETK